MSGLKHVTPAKQPKVRVLVVDDHPLVRDGLAELIDGESDLLCCGKVGSPLEAQRAAAAENPQLALVDLHLGKEDGIELIRILRSQFPGLRILVISQLDETLHAEAALRAGALGYVMKEHATDELLKAIRKVLAGRVYLSPGVAAMLLSPSAGKGSSQANPPRPSP